LQAAGRKRLHFRGGIRNRKETNMANPDRSPLTPQILATEKACYFGSAGCSAGSRPYGFRPAFLDRDTGRIYFSAFADGRPAPVHMLDGLPQTLVVARAPSGRVCAVKASVISGFARDGCFYTRDEAMRLADGEGLPMAA
jgi:hypothetical protein